jgi:dienelactone hydrolase
VKTLSQILRLLLLASLIATAQAQVAHHFTGITVDTNATATVQLDGSVSNLFSLTASMRSQYLQMFDIYLLDASPDLTQWTRQAMLLRLNSDPTPLSWQDTNTGLGTARFYRTPTNYLVTPFPKPSGPYAVGKVVRILTDPTRTNRYGIETNGSFMSTIWYPADPLAARSLPALYTDPAVARDTAYSSQFGWPGQWGAVIAAFVTVTYTNVPVASGTNRFPVIVHSHGISADRTQNSQNLSELASHGYIVAAVDHEDCHCTVFPDARGARYVSPDLYIPAWGQSRTNDMEVLLRALTQFDSVDPILAGRLDLNSIGAIGKSWGGGTAGELCRNDSRVKCAVLLDPAIFSDNGPNLVAVGLQKPFLTMNSTVWVHPNVIPSPSDLAVISSNLFYLATTNATWFKVANAAHLTFSDPGWTMDMTSTSRSAAQAIDAGTLWFFDTHLKGETPPFPTNPEIINAQRK